MIIAVYTRKVILMSRKFWIGLSVAGLSALALAGAQARYGAGSGDFLTVLDSERAAITAREQMTQYKLARLQAVVGLCKALGGGWEEK